MHIYDSRQTSTTIVSRTPEESSKISRALSAPFLSPNQPRVDRHRNKSLGHTGIL